MRARELVDISLDIGTRRQRRRRRLIRVAIPVGCLVLMIASIGFIAVYAYQNNRHDALELTDDLLETLDRRIAAEVRNYLGPASDTVQLLANIIRDPSIGITDRSQIEPFVIPKSSTLPTAPGKSNGCDGIPRAEPLPRKKWRMIPMMPAPGPGTSVPPRPGGYFGRMYIFSLPISNRA